MLDINESENQGMDAKKRIICFSNGETCLMPARMMKEVGKIP